jgi:hypothetical protein
MSKYVNFYQQEQTLHSCEETSRVNDKCTKSNIVHFASEESHTENLPDSSVLTHLKNKCSEPVLAHKLSYNPNPHLNPPTLQRGRTEVNRSELSSCPSQELTNTYPLGCLTIKTVNNLLENNEVSLHESNGSFMSLKQSQGSEYQGMLCQMGRSVDILNIPSSKQVLGLRKPTPNVNRSNC